MCWEISFWIFNLLSTIFGTRRARGFQIWYVALKQSTNQFALNIRKLWTRVTRFNPYGFLVLFNTNFIQYKERERYQRLSLYEGIRPDVTDLESILRREENRSTRRKTLGVRLRSTETQPTYDLEARVEPGSQRWEVRLITTKPFWLPLQSKPPLQEKNGSFYWMASNSQAIWSTLVGGFLVGILQYGPLPWKRLVSVFFSLPGNSSERKTKSFKKRNFICSSQRYN